MHVLPDSVGKSDSLRELQSGLFGYLAPDLWVDSFHEDLFGDDRGNCCIISGSFDLSGDPSIEQLRAFAHALEHSFEDVFCLVLVVLVVVGFFKPFFACVVSVYEFLRQRCIYLVWYISSDDMCRNGCFIGCTGWFFNKGVEDEWPSCWSNVVDDEVSLEFCEEFVDRPCEWVESVEDRWLLHLEFRLVVVWSGWFWE